MNDKTDTQYIIQRLDETIKSLLNDRVISLSTTPSLTFWVYDRTTKEDARAEFSYLCKIFNLRCVDPDSIPYRVRAYNPDEKHLQINVYIDKDVLYEKRTVVKETTEFYNPSTGEIA